MVNKKNVKVIDLFCGAGGLSQGLEGLGCDTTIYVDNDKNSLETIKLNKKDRDRTLLADLFSFDTRSLKERAGITSDPFLIVGGPPCQPFSKNAYWIEKGEDSKFRRDRSKGLVGDKPDALSEPRKDKRRFLIDVFADAVDENKPDGFIF